MFSLPSYAELSTGNERDACFKEHKEIADAYNCLHQKRLASDSQLAALISEASKKFYPTMIIPQRSLTVQLKLLVPYTITIF